MYEILFTSRHAYYIRQFETLHHVFLTLTLRLYVATCRYRICFHIFMLAMEQIGSYIIDD